MARTLRGLTPALGALPMILLWALPLTGSAIMLLPAASRPTAWQLLFQHPQLWSGLLHALICGGGATVLALVMTMTVLAGFRHGTSQRRLQAAAAAGLALPHLAFAIGFGFLIMPSGLIARLTVGGELPPAWVTTQDPWGLSLTAALALKELPFLLVTALASLMRGDSAVQLQQECRAAASLGHGAGSVWLRITLPRLLAGLRWPLVIVFVYGTTVVDMAIILGPTQPPTLPVIIWTALNHADPAVNGMGMAMTLLLTMVLAMFIAAIFLLAEVTRPLQRRFLSAGPSRLPAPRQAAWLLAGVSSSVMVLAILLLGFLSVTPRWPYPALLPPVLNLEAWSGLLKAPAPLWLSLQLSAAAAVTAIGLAVLWFETQPPPRDRWLIGLALLSLALPQLAVASGQYRLFLDLGLTGTLSGLFLAHLAPVTAYVLIVLQGPYRAFDQRYMQAARSLSVPEPRALLLVKLPLLKAPLLTAGAIGFAVSIAQFVPAQLIAAGRYSTLTMEAVTLSSGGNRSLMAAFALCLAALPLIAFLAVGRLGRPRWH